MSRSRPARTSPSDQPEPVLEITVDPSACRAYGYCAELLGELVSLDEWGYPVIDEKAVPQRLAALARKAARDCPRRAVLLTEARR